MTKPRKPTSMLCERKVFAGVGVIGFRMNGLRLQSEMNKREHWAVLYKRKKTQHHIAALGMHGLNPIEYLGSELRITLTRIGPRTLDDDANVSSFKFIRDAIAQVIWGGRMGQRDDLAEWRYEQRRGSYGIEVRFEQRKRGAA